MRNNSLTARARRYPEAMCRSIRIQIIQEGTEGAELSFSDTFCIGRGSGCDVEVHSGRVSRKHVEIACRDGRWLLRDLDSTNGTYVGGERIEQAEVRGDMEVQLGLNGPLLRLRTEIERSGAEESDKTFSEDRSEDPRASEASLTQYIRHYFTEDESREPAGKHTLMIRRAYDVVRQEEQRRYHLLVGVFLGLLVLAVGYGAVQYMHNRRLEEIAGELFYQLKEVDLAIAQQRQIIEEMEDEKLSERLNDLRRQRERLAEQYDGYVNELGIRRQLSDEERLIHTMARIFNESELEIPAGFIREVREEIREYWLADGQDRFITAVRRAEEKGYARYIVETMRAYDLPPELYYLALQESDLKTDRVGPHTRWGIAKGMWQFIPSTARAYGLKVGPRAAERVVDTQDDRHDFQASTAAAARYLSDLYSNLAQASGLLAIASYNWGETRVVGKLDRLFRGIPESPRARSYWRFYQEYDTSMPQETKDYVLRVFAAAVIGQDPRHFGIEMDNPLHPYLEAPGVETE